MSENENMIWDEMEMYKTSPWMMNQSTLYLAPANDDVQFMQYVPQGSRAALLKNKRWWKQPNDKFYRLMSEKECKQTNEVSRFGDFECLIAYYDKNSNEFVQRNEEIDAAEKEYLRNNKQPISKYIEEFMRRKPSKEEVAVVVENVSSLLETADKEVVRDLRKYLENTQSIRELAHRAGGILAQLVPKVREISEDSFVSALKKFRLGEVFEKEHHLTPQIKHSLEYNVYINKLRDAFEQNLINKLVLLSNPNFKYEPLDVESIECSFMPETHTEVGEVEDGVIEDTDDELDRLLKSDAPITFGVFTSDILEESDDDDDGSVRTIDSTDDEDEYEYEIKEEMDEDDGDVVDMCRKCGQKEILPFKSVLWVDDRPKIVQFCSIKCIEDLDWGRHKLQRKQR